MKKIYFILVLIVLVVISLYIYRIRPSEEEKNYHRAAVCYIIQHHDIHADNDQSFGRIKNILDYSVPDYAYNKPKVYPDLIHKIIRDYLTLSDDNKKIAKNDSLQCNAILKNKS